ncbi:MAG: sigma 54-interacting transcriptional regulator [Candidatus Poribacteria bacterium]
MSWVSVGDEAQIERGGCRVVQAAGRSIALFNVDGELCAIDNTCPHQGGPLGEGELDGDVVTCPWHEWSYSVRTGAAVATPAVETFEVRTRDGGVEVALDIADEGGSTEGGGATRATEAVEDPVFRVLQRIQLGRSLDEVFHNIYTDLQEAVPHDRLGLALLDEGSGRLVQVKTVSNRPLRLDNGFAARIAGTSLERMMELGEPRSLDDLRAHVETHPSTWTRLLVEEGMRASLTLPLQIQGRPIGFVFFSSTEPAAFTEEHIGKLLQIAGHLSVLIENGQWVSELAQHHERYRTLMEVSGDAIFVCSADDLRFVTFNDNLCDWLGYSYGELAKLSLDDLLPESDRAIVRQHIDDLAPASAPAAFRTSFARRTGPGLPVGVRVVRSERLGQDVVHGFAHDISELVALREHADGGDPLPNLVGSNHRMQEAFELIRQVAPMPTTVLIQGESGTGKEPVARAIHALSDRSDRPFVAVSCAALAEGVLESELFGHEAGSYTGATATRKGRFETADTGTIFLDEIGDLGPAMQVKLLRVLQESEFERVGSSETMAVDVRVIAATNRDLRAAMGDGSFRADLYYRLNVVPIVLPPLRERPDDIPLLVDHFIDRFRALTGKAIDGVSREALRVLLDHPFPGNVRELENVIEHAFVRSPGGVVEVEHLPAELTSRPADAVALALATSDPMGALEAELARRTLEECGGNRTRAAARLGISRTTLWRKLRGAPSSPVAPSRT